MSKIQDLIKEKCPNGVKYKSIIDITNVLRGKRLTTKQLSKKEKFPVYHGGLEPLGYYHDFNRFGDTVMIINVGASAGTVGYCKNNFWSSDGCYCIEHRKELSNRYLYHYLKNFENYFIGKVRRAGIPTLDGRVIEKFKIPIPPIEVQEEIVKILDKFGKLEAELEAELEARKKQYEFWRMGLLSEEKNHGKYKKYNITELCNEIFAGGDVPNDTIKGLQSPEGEYVYPVISNGVGLNAIYGYSKNYKVDCKSCVTIAARGTIGYHDVRYGKFTPIIRLITLIPNEKIVTAKYLNYVLYDYQFKSSGGGIPQLTIPTVKQLSLFIPSLEEQKRIVNILDKFDKLVNDISEGIPAEIELRRKQYEYYRNKLLSFKELKVNE